MFRHSCVSAARLCKEGHRSRRVMSKVDELRSGVTKNGQRPDTMEGLLTSAAAKKKSFAAQYRIFSVTG